LLENTSQDNEQEKKAYHTEINELILRRYEELEELIKLGINPYPHKFNRTDLTDSIIKNFQKEGLPKSVSVAGRIMSIRRMGKATFFHLQDSAGKIQVYLKKEDIGQMYDAFRLIDIGDIVGVSGFVFRTKMGEISIHAQSFEILSKSLRPFPIVKEKIDQDGNKIIYDPFTDKELRYRLRYVDLIVNQNVRDIFFKRTQIVNVIREFLNDKGYLEVETPILQPIYGGAFAKPFITYHNKLNIEMYLRIANELYLKRLIVGGFDGVYEFAKDFRNEGMDRTHNPEFTMLELYVAYKDYIWMMELVEDLLSKVVQSIHSSNIIKIGNNEINFSQPFKQISMYDAIKEFTNRNVEGLTLEELQKLAKELQVDVDPDSNAGKVIDAIFGQCVEPNLIQPTFIIDYPIEMSPLAKKHRSKTGIVERFELIVNGCELCNAFSELNDPIDQRNRFEHQANLRMQGDEEANMIDEDYIRALEYGMPPTAGLGIGIDRLIMLLTNQDSIRDVIFFPQMKPE